MDHQLTFACSEFNHQRRQTSKEKFLKLTSWQRLVAIIEPYYRQCANARCPSLDVLTVVVSAKPLSCEALARGGSSIVVIK